MRKRFCSCSASYHAVIAAQTTGNSPVQAVDKSRILHFSGDISELQAKSLPAGMVYVFDEIEDWSDEDRLRRTRQLLTRDGYVRAAQESLRDAVADDCAKTLEPAQYWRQMNAWQRAEYDTAVLNATYRAAIDLGPWWRQVLRFLGRVCRKIGSAFAHDFIESGKRGSLP